MTVYHYGQHTCPVKKKAWIDSSEKEIVKEAFIKNPSLMANGKALSEIEDLANIVTNQQDVKNIKKTALKERRPHGHSLDALDKLKENADKRDKFYLFRCNNQHLSPKDPTYVFKTSSLKAKMAAKMDRKSDGLLSKKYIHFDGKGLHNAHIKCLSSCVKKISETCCYRMQW